MTAEIAILNKSAVALAADSKVTIGGAGGSKTFDTVNKIFTLSKVHPVGVMIYNNAEFMNYPWEVIVKLYRAQKRDRREDTIEQWGIDFVRYLRSFGTIRSTDISANIINVAFAWLDDITAEAQKDAIAYGIPIPSDEYTKTALGVCERRLSELENIDDALTKRQSASLLKTHGPNIDNCVESWLSGVDAPELATKVRELLPSLLVKNVYSPMSSGIVIAGFGERELFPTLVAYETDGYMGNGLKIAQTRHSDISRDYMASVVPFAQTDMVQRFMDGIDMEYFGFWGTTLFNTVLESALSVLDEYGHEDNKTDEVRMKLHKATSAALQSSVENAQRFQSDMFSSPIMQTIALLPKEELPHLAESLVALTSLKRHVSDDLETVGGPIDVALISKTDGFIWIKRKHYFLAERNPQFERNYMRGVTEGERIDGSQIQETDRTQVRRSRPPASKGTRRPSRSRTADEGS